MSMAPDLNLIIRIEKLLAQADDQSCTQAEREAFEAKAYELMERHRIDRALVGGHLAADDVIVDEVLGDFNGIYGRVRIEIAGRVASAFDCNIYWSGYGNSRRLRVHGFRSDVDQVSMLINRLLADADLRVQAVAAADVSMYNSSGERYTSERGAVHAATIRERRGFYQGYADAVGSRLQAAKRNAEAAHQEEAGEAASKQAALVLVDRRKQASDSFRSRVNARPAGTIDGTGQSGYGSGAEAGRQANLSTQNQVGSRKALGR